MAGRPRQAADRHGRDARADAAATSGAAGEIQPGLGLRGHAGEARPGDLPGAARHPGPSGSGARRQPPAARAGRRRATPPARRAAPGSRWRDPRSARLRVHGQPGGGRVPAAARRDPAQRRRRQLPGDDPVDAGHVRGRDGRAPRDGRRPQPPAAPEARRSVRGRAAAQLREVPATLGADVPQRSGELRGVRRAADAPDGPDGLAAPIPLSGDAPGAGVGDRVRLRRPRAAADPRRAGGNPRVPLPAGSAGQPLRILR